MLVHQLVVGAHFGESALVKDDKLVGMGKGREAVGYRYRRSALAELVQALLNLALGLGVE